jgi:hypothetical protein
MQMSYMGYTANKACKESTLDAANGTMFLTIRGVNYTVVQHERAELANGDWTSTVVLQSPDVRIVLRGK